MNAHPNTPESSEGQRRKLDAHATLETRRESYIRRGQRALLAALLMNGTATADDVRAAVTLPEGINPVCLGVVPGPLARAGIIRRKGFESTQRAEGHARPVSIWELLDRAAAERWQHTHPDMPDEAEAVAGTLFDPSTKKPGVGAPGSN